MKTAIDILKALVLLALLAILIPVAYEINHQRATFESDVRRVSALIARTEQTMANFKEATDQWQTTQQQVAQDSTSVLSETKNTLATISETVSKLDASLQTMVSQQNQSLLQTQEQLRQNLQEMSKATEQLQTTLASADAVISSPELQKSLASLAESSEHTSEATASLAATTKDVQQVADAFRSDYLKPKNRALAYLKAILGLGSQSRILLSK